jgi:hypothetical protein
LAFIDRPSSATDLAREVDPTESPIERVAIEFAEARVGP